MNDKELMKMVYDNNGIKADNLSADEVLKNSGKGGRVKRNYLSAVVAAAVMLAVGAGGYFAVRGTSETKVEADEIARSAASSQSSITSSSDASTKTPNESLSEFKQPYERMAIATEGGYAEYCLSANDSLAIKIWYANHKNDRSDKVREGYPFKQADGKDAPGFMTIEIEIADINLLIARKMDGEVCFDAFIKDQAGNMTYLGQYNGSDTDNSAVNKIFDSFMNLGSDDSTEIFSVRIIKGGSGCAYADTLNNKVLIEWYSQHRNDKSEIKKEYITLDELKENKDKTAIVLTTYKDDRIITFEKADADSDKFTVFVKDLNNVDDSDNVFLGEYSESDPGNSKIGELFASYKTIDPEDIENEVLVNCEEGFKTSFIADEPDGLDSDNKNLTSGEESKDNND